MGPLAGQLTSRRHTALLGQSRMDHTTMQLM